MRERPNTVESGKTVREWLNEMGFSETTARTMQVAIRLGARRILKFHKASLEDLKIVLKPDAGMSPVTAADLESGKIIKGLIARYYPEDSINEEESGLLERGGSRRWEIDPLDGTSSFAREQSYSTVGSAFYENGKPVAAAICHPFERELVIAEVGKGAYSFSLDEKLAVAGAPERIRVSERETLENGIVYIDAFFNEKTTPLKLKLIRKLVKCANDRLGIRMTGSSIDQQRNVAHGRAEATITDAVGGFYDLAAGSIIIKEAGGEFVDMKGDVISAQTQVGIGGNKKIIEQILPLIQECYKGYLGFRS